MPLPSKRQAPKPTRAEQKAIEILEKPHRLARILIREANAGMDALWGRKGTFDVDEVTENLAELGTDAAAVFQENNDLITFLSTKVAGTEHEERFQELVDRVANLPAFTINQDGSVTLD